MTIVRPIPDMACGCDGPHAATGLIGLDDALARIGAAFDAVAGTEHLAVSWARGRVLAEAVHALSDMPRFDHAAMDGYAIRTGDLSGAGPWHLPVSLRCAAGEGRPPALPAGSAARIFTGAPVPRGADCVIMQESVLRHADRIEIVRRPGVGENIRFRGEEQRAGSPILSRGSRLTPGAIAAAAAGGHGHVLVRRALRVALLVSGSELRTAGCPGRTDGTVWDVNTPMLQAAMTRPDIRLVAVRRVPDDATGSRAALAEAAEVADLVVTTGGVSVGEEDHLRAAFRDIGGVEVFSGVAIKPGKPVTCGLLGDVAWLGLPGNPLSAFVTWQLFGETILERLTGLTGGRSRKRHVVLSHPVERKVGRCEIRPASLVGHDGVGRDMIACRGAIRSGQVGRLVGADGLVFLPSEADRLPVGALVEFLPFCSDRGSA